MAQREPFIQNRRDALIYLAMMVSGTVWLVAFGVSLLIDAGPAYDLVLGVTVVLLLLSSLAAAAHFHSNLPFGRNQWRAVRQACAKLRTP